MASIINIKVAEPTKAHPFKFFHAFFTPGTLEKIRDNFFKVLEPNENEMNQLTYLYTPYKDKDYFEIEYSDYEYNYDDHDMIPIGINQIVKPFYFRNELTEYLKSEFYQAKDLLIQHMSEDKKKANLKTFLENEVTKITRCLEFIDHNQFYQTYAPECKRPLNAIIRMIYKDYPSLKPPADKIISDILKNAKDYPIDYIPSGIRTSLANALLQFTDEDDELIFFKEIDRLDSTTLIDEIRKFICGEFSEIHSPINFTKNIEAVHYLIFQIANINGYSLVEIENSKVITTNGRAFKADTCSKGKRSFISKNTKLKKEIDVLLKIHEV